jgi:uncharacterized membrane protein YgdD (TMEM256/DUF423 family)
MAQLSLVFGALGGMFAVAFGAFGAHAVRARLDEYSLRIFETAVQYQFYHSLALLAVALLLQRFPSSTLLQASVWLFLSGILIFSGSLYILSLTGQRWLGAVTPIGGLALVAAWGCLAAAAWKLL